MFLNELKENLNLNTFEDWNSITAKQIQFNGGRSLLHTYSLLELKCLGFPEGKLEFYNHFTPAGFWNNEKNVINFLNNLKNKLNLKSIEDWNSLTQKQIEINGGRTLLQKYSLYELKCLGFPDGSLFFDTTNKPAGYWNDKNNVLKFLDELKEILNLTTIEDWNSITAKQIQFNGGSTLLLKYSIFELKCLACPEGKLEFDRAYRSPKPPGYWDNEENIKQFLNELQKKYNLRNIQDWSRTSTEQIRENGGDGLMNKYSLDEIIQIVFPDTKIERESKFGVLKRASQRWLFIQTQKLFPQEEIIEDYFHSEISRKTGYAVQFDIFLINKNIAIEYHGIQHYEDIPSGFAPLELYKVRDEEKKRICSEFGIKLIIIPYWWNNTLDALKETLRTEIEDLVF